MQNSNLKIQNREFINYKFFNSLFLGISVGSIFILYTPLSPSIFSIGGILLAVAMLVVAKFYSKILNINYFYKISLLVEIVPFVLVTIFLIFSYSYIIALLIYIGYQITFTFGSYLVRVETMLFNKAKLLTFLDVTKQKGYLVGMAISFIFYKILENSFHITSYQEQVYYIHFLLLAIESITIYLLLKSFKNEL